MITCSKCNGSGKWCKGYVNGEPYSFTGFSCWKCGGTGKIGNADGSDKYLNKCRITTLAKGVFKAELRVLTAEGKREWRETIVECEHEHWVPQRAEKQLGF